MTRHGSRIERGLMAADNFTQISNALFRDPRLSFKAKGVFGLISTHRDGYGLTVAAIARAGRDGRDAVQSALVELERFGYLERVQRHGDSGQFAGVVYRITDMPAHLFELFGEDAPTLPTARASCSAPMTGFPATGHPAPADPASKNTNNKNTRVEEQQGEAPSARRAADARRAPTGSSGRARRSGSAATEQAPTSSRKPAAKGPRLTGEQAEAVAVVERAIPAALVDVLPYRQLPKALRLAVVAELEHRTPEQLAARVARRWDAHGYADDALSKDGPGLRRPVAVAAALVRPGECPDPSCEDGHMIDTGAPCRTCEQRKADRPAASRRPRRAAAEASWTCGVCEEPQPGTAPSDGVCSPECREVAGAFSGLRARLDSGDEVTAR